MPADLFVRWMDIWLVSTLAIMLCGNCQVHLGGLCLISFKYVPRWGAMGHTIYVCQRF